MLSKIPTVPLNRYKYLSEFLRAGTTKINRAAIQDLYTILRERYPDAPGSRAAHHAWAGGYFDHVTEACNLFGAFFYPLHHCREIPDSFLPEGIEVLLLHDIEKPFMYCEEVQPRLEWTKAERAAFRAGVFSEYKIQLSPAQVNALETVEGETQYVPGKRQMQELGALCHIADVASARIWHEAGKRKTWYFSRELDTPNDQSTAIQ